MGLTFREKMQLNAALLDRLRLKLLDKPQSRLSPDGRLYNFVDPANESLFGSIGQERDPNYDGPQPPNSMGMVLLVRPDESGHIRMSLSGQFDLCHRYIPDIDLMLANLLKGPDGTKHSQQVVKTYKRYTIHFKDLSVSMLMPKDENVWIEPDEPNPLNQALDDLEASLRADPRVYREGQPRNRGYRLFFTWSDDIDNQEALNHAVSRDMFDANNDILHYQVRIRARARRAPVSLSSVPNAYLLEVYLENQTSRELSKRFDIYNPHLLDAQFELDLTAGEHELLPHRLSPPDFRYQPGNGIPGYGITTSVEHISARRFRTNALPVSQLLRFENPSSTDLGMAQGPSFEVLRENPVAVAKALLKAIGQFESDWIKDIDSLSSSGKREEAAESQRSLEEFRAEKVAIRDGIELLRINAGLRQCFCWMNEAMSNAARIQGKRFTQWRLFQLGFILTQVRAVYDRCCPDQELTEHIETAEVLWFSTGGGKTEAYLGIILMAMLYERQCGKNYGTTAWMRFPLRMLSVQQFQRLSYGVAQANIIRQREGLGGHPFTIGYFTGTGTPKRITSAYESDRADFLPNFSSETLKAFQFIQDCPYCESKQSLEIRRDLNKGRIGHVCTNAACWSNTEADTGQYGEGIRGEIGIYISDEECYRYLPTVMVGTLDKLAVISHNKRMRYFFGAATHFCPDHGFSTGGRCVHNRLIQKDDGSYTTEQCSNNSRTSKVRTQALGAMRFPGISFLLQDELHLLRENMGNFDAHYETLFNALQVANGGRMPKYLSATATIKEYDHHLRHLYLRRGRRFPAPGYQLNESFYSRIKTAGDGTPDIQRLYAGLLPLCSGQAKAKATAAISARHLTLIDEITDGMRTDPATTASGLGFEISKAQDLLSHMTTYLNTNLIYANSFRSIGDIVQQLEEEQSEFSQRRYWLLSGKTSLDEIQSCISHIESKSPDDDLRQIIATSVVSHGVDMHRLNFMVISGWPKSIAEYLQASARSGRIEPGIVMTVLNNLMLYEMNVFMNFSDYHKFLDRLVESVPINRFAPNLVDRTLPGIIGAWIVNWAAGQGAPWGENINKNAGKVRAALKDRAHNGRQQLGAKIVQSLSIPNWLEEHFDSRVIEDFMRAFRRQVEIALNQLEGMPADIADAYLSEAMERLLGRRPMRNLRDIESQISVIPHTREAGEVLDSLGKRG